MKCVICKESMDKQGHNAEPVKKGRCCNFCNATKVIPARLAQSSQREYETYGDMRRND